MRMFYFILLACGLSMSVVAQDLELSRFQYWFDKNHTGLAEQVLSGDSVSIETSIDTSLLSEGMHSLYYRICDSEGAWSPLQVWTFFVSPLQQRGDKSISSVEYWIDSDGHHQTAVVSDSIWMQALDVSAFKEGMHALYFRFGDTKGVWSPLQTWYFFAGALRNHGGKAVDRVEYWIDGNIAERKQATISDDLWNIEMDMSSMTEGMHTLYYRFGDNYGDYMPLQQAMFSKQRQKASSVKTLRYWWGDYTDRAVDVEVGELTFIYETLLTVPDYAKRDPGTDRGIARFCCVAIDDLGRMSPAMNEEIIYGRGPLLKADNYRVTVGNAVKLSWSYEDPAGVRDYSVYYSLDDGPWVMYVPSQQETSLEFKGIKGNYSFVVVARNNLGQRTNLDYEWSVNVCFE